MGFNSGFKGLIHGYSHMSWEFLTLTAQTLFSNCSFWHVYRKKN